jgi:precorrin-3B methylase
MDTQIPEFFVITTAISAASAIAASLSFYYNNKMNKLNSLVKAFEILNDNAHRNARIRLYRAAEIPNEAAKDAHLTALGVKKKL